MKKFKDTSIRTKIVLIIITVTVISAIIGFTGILLFEYDNMKSDLENEADMSAALVSQYCVSSLSLLDKEGTEEALEKLSYIPIIQAAFVFDSDGMLFATYYKDKTYDIIQTPDNIPSIKKDTTYKNKYGLNIIKPIISEEVFYGNIQVVASYDELVEGLFNYLIVIVIVLIFIALISIFPASSLQNVISEPILELTYLTQRISNNKDYGIRAKKSGDDEIGILYDGFNNMLEQIERRDRQRDIVEIALRESEEYHRVLFETMTQGAIYFASDGRVMSANRAAEYLFSMSSLEMKNSGFDLSNWDVIHENGTDFINEDFPAWVAMRTGRKVENVIMGIFNKEEKIYRWVMVSAIPILNDTGNELRRIYTTLNDITSRKNVEEEKEILNKELIDKNNELEQIIYVTSHDLRSPLVNIQGFSNEVFLSIEELKSISDRFVTEEKDQESLNRIVDIDLPESLSYIQSSVHRMDALLKGLLKLSRYGRVELNMKMLDMNKLAENAINNLEFQIKEKNIAIRKDNLPSCYGDEDQISQVFANIIGNAVKYSDNKEGAFIHISASSTSNMNIYHIKDNGIGISKDFHGKIFELFHRLAPSETQGEGLGLTIVKKIIDRHNGKISLDSEPGKGTTFYITLPMNKR